MKKTVKNKRKRVPDHRASQAVPSPVSARGNVFAAVLLVLLCSIASLQRNTVWDTKLSLWYDVAKKSPLKSRAHNNLGNCYALLGRLFDAIEQYKIAIALDKGNIEPYYNLGMYLEDVGNLNQALYYYDYFCKVAPTGYAEEKKKSCKRVQTIARRAR